MTLGALIKFTAEQRKRQQMPFDRHPHCEVYRQATHTDQHLLFSSHRPLERKLIVIRTLLYIASNIVTKEEDRKQEEHHIHTALSRCRYPDWSIDNVKIQVEQLIRTKSLEKPTIVTYSRAKQVFERPLPEPTGDMVFQLP